MNFCSLHTEEDSVFVLVELVHEAFNFSDQNRKGVLDHRPDDLVPNDHVTVNQLISEVDDPSKARNPLTD